ncbi:MAG: hypothetical protein GX811_07295 [Lentisphaerae bacterium]|nr:hypothetical protein [Lentisphaerota bacterium]
MNAIKSQTFPGEFGTKQRMKESAPFAWPEAPGSDGVRVNIRTLGETPNSDFSTQLIKPTSKIGWFSALNPKLGVMVAYVWNRADYPWVGNWEENCGRESIPWRGKSLTRGMEFANSPFPIGLRASVDLGRFQNQRTYAWLPALGKVTTEYSILMRETDPKFVGVAEIRRKNGAIDIDFIV